MDSTAVIAVLADPALSTLVSAALRCLVTPRPALTFMRDLGVAAAVSARTPFDALVVEDALFAAADPAQAATLIERMAVVAVGRPGSPWGPDVLARGARRHLMAGPQLEEQLAETLVALCGERPAVPRTVNGRTIGFLGCAGGAGTTSALLNCGAALVRQGRTVIAVEVGGWGSAFAAQLDLAPAYTLGHVLADPAQVAARAESALVSLPCGLRVLCADTRPRAASPADARALDRLVHALSRLAEVVLVDLPTPLPIGHDEVVRHLDHVVVVAPARPGRPAAIGPALSRLQACGVGATRASVLHVSRSSGSVEAPSASGAPATSLGRLPADPPLFQDAAARGLPLVAAHPDSAVAAAALAAATELMGAAGDQRIKVALVGETAEQARVAGDLLAEADTARFELVRAGPLADAIAELKGGAFHAALVFAAEGPERLAEDLDRLAEACERTAIVVVAPGPDAQLLERALARGAQDAVDLGHMDSYWLAHCLVTAVERQRERHLMRAQSRALSNCEASHRRIIMQLLRENQHDPRMV